MRVLVLGGTTEGRELGARLAGAGVDTTVSVATDAGAQVLGDRAGGPSVLVGRLDAQGFARLIENRFDLVADATHPYAVEASANARAACLARHVEYLRVVRPASTYEGCIVADDLPGAIASVRRAGNVLATTGSKEIGRYTALPDWRERLFARVLDDPASVGACIAAGLRQDRILRGMGPFSVEDNAACISENGIETLVTKDGGRPGGFYEKVAACRALGVDCIVVRRPMTEPGVTVDQALENILSKKEARPCGSAY